MSRHLTTGAVARTGCRLGALVSAVMLVVSGWVLVSGTHAPAGAATNQGSLTLAEPTGNSDTVFEVSFTGGDQSCPGDANEGYTVQGFVVPVATDINTLEFTSVGPQGGNALLTSDGELFVDQQVDLTTANISYLPRPFTFSFNSASDYPPGSYVLGVACTKGVGPDMTQRYWATGLTIASDTAGGGSLGFTYAVAAGPTPTTTESTTTTLDGTTTTTGDGTTTTTEGTTTTTDGTTTTTGGSAGGGGGVSSGGVSSGGSPSSASPVSTVGQLPYTGSSPLPLVVWAIALIVFGRMAMLLGTRAKVIEDGATG